MKNMKSFSSIIESIYTTALEVSNEARKDGVFEIKNLSIELSVVIEQKLTCKREIDTKVQTKSNSCSYGITKKDNNLSSQIGITFVPKTLSLTSS